MTDRDSFVGQVLRCEIENGTFAFPRIYDTSQFHPDARPCHSVSIPASLLPSGLLPYVQVSARFGAVVARSQTRPMVCTLADTDEELDRLVRILHRLDAQNLSRDVVFRGRRIAVTVKVVRVSRPIGPSPLVLALQSVQLMEPLS